MRLRAGAEVEADCAGLDERGAATAPLGGARLHVAGALPGERVRAVIEHVSPHRPGRAWARLARVLRASPERVAPVCPAYGPCGGCPLQHLDYPAQVRWKGERVAEALARAPALAGVPVAPCVPSPRPLGYRNQAKYVYGPDAGGRTVLGAYVPRTHAIVDMAGCRVVEPVLDEVAAAVRDVLAAAAVPPFDERARTGLLRYVVLRASAAGEVLATLVSARPDLPGAEGLAGRLRAAHPAVAGVVLNVNPTAGNVLFGSDERILDGRGTIEDALGPARVALAPRSFFQINRAVAARAYDEIRRAVAARAPGGRVVDAYAGAGGIAFTLAGEAREVVALEENAAATALAAWRAPANVRFVTGDVAAHLGALGPAEVVVLNPPRSGCAPAVLAQVARLSPRLVAYLSCHPGTLARDLAVLAGAGLRPTTVLPLDMLPHTPHVEALALVERA